MTDDPYIDLGFLDCTCERCGAGNCQLWEGARPGEWLCDDCVNDGQDAISRLMRSDNLSFMQAVQQLARKP